MCPPFPLMVRFLYNGDVHKTAFVKNPLLSASHLKGSPPRSGHHIIELLELTSHEQMPVVQSSACNLTNKHLFYQIVIFKDNYRYPKSHWWGIAHNNPCL